MAVLHPSTLIASSNLYGAIALHARANGGVTLDWVEAIHPYLRDGRSVGPPAVTNGKVITLKHPRISQLEGIHPAATPATVATYNHIADRGSSWASLIEPAYAIDPSLIYTRHICPAEFQGHTQSTQGFISAGVGFDGTGPISQFGPPSVGDDVYAGHWLYKAGTTITTVGGIAAGTLTFTVADGTKLEAGQYACIYNAPFGGFANPEHVLVSAVNAGTGAVTVSVRGYKSTAAAHAQGSIIAQHCRGGSTNPLQWAFNVSTLCPDDGAGNRYCDYYPVWLSQWYTKRQDNVPTTINIQGITFDTDEYFWLRQPADADNDGTVDNARVGAVNHHGAGWDVIYSTLATLLPNLHLMAGVHSARGQQWFTGMQLENSLDYGNGDFLYPPRFERLSEMVALYFYNCQERARGPVLVQFLTKTASAAYPGNGSGATPTTNQYQRMALALCLMEQGFFATHSNYAGDAWWDEYAVNVVPAHADYGKAVLITDMNARRAHRNWMGNELGRFKRIYKWEECAPGASLVSNGEFATDTANWEGLFTTISRIATGGIDGGPYLHATTMTTYQGAVDAAYVRRSAGIALTAGQEYTLCFAARANVFREILLRFGAHATGADQYMPIGPNWRRYVVSWKQSAAGTPRLHFMIGRENTEFDLDSVYLFAGNANVFRRDFEKCIVLCNLSESEATIPLGGPFKRILGAQDPTVNSGATVTEVVLQARDGLILVRPDA